MIINFSILHLQNVEVPGGSALDRPVQDAMLDRPRQSYSHRSKLVPNIPNEPFILNVIIIIVRCLYQERTFGQRAEYLEYFIVFD